MSFKNNVKKDNDIKLNSIEKYLLKVIEKLEKGEEKEKIKENIIKEFKEDKSMITNILQKLLKEQIFILEQKTQKFKNKEYFTKEEIDKHNNEINELQRKINIIYQRSSYHINSIMEDLCQLLEKIDELFLNYKD